MKILSVKFENLNSLKGLHEIRFDEAPFSQSGLFAITGPTGSGKTTILDAITVALYGKVHRHHKNTEEILSRHTGSCFAEVEFEVKNIAYRSRWSLKRSKGKADGALQGEKMELAIVESGALLGGHTLTSVKQAIIECCGLDYNQFLRSVILSQGDFTRFLKADDNERSELLEKITDTGIYSSISIAAYEKQKTEKEKLDLLFATLNGLEILPDDQVAAHELHLQQCAEEDRVLTTAQNLLGKQLNWLQQLYKLEDRKKQLNAGLEDKLLLHKQHEADFLKLEKHQQASRFKPELKEIQTFENQHYEISENLEFLNISIPTQQLELIDAQEQYGQADQALKENLSRQNEQTPVFQQVIKLDSELNAVIQQVESARKMHLDGELQLNTLVQRQEFKRTEIKALMLKVKDLQQWLHDHQQDEQLDKMSVQVEQSVSRLKEIGQAILQIQSEYDGLLEINRANQLKYSSIQNVIQREKTVLEVTAAQLQSTSEELQAKLGDQHQEDIERQLSDLPKLINNCEKQYQFATDYALLESQLAGLEQAISAHKIVLNQSQQQFAQLDEEQKKAELHLVDLRLMLELEQRIKNYDADRLALEPGKPCPLCGATDHPYAETHQLPLTSHSKQQYENHEKHLKTLQERFNAQKIELERQGFLLNNQLEEQARVKEQISKILSAFDETNLYLPKPLDIQKPEIIAGVVRSKQKLLLQLQTDLTAVRNLVQKIQELQQQKANDTQELARHEASLQVMEGQIKSTDDLINRVQDQMKTETGNKNDISASLKSSLAIYNLDWEKEDWDLIQKQILERKDAYLKTSRELITLQNSESKLLAEQEAIDQDLKEKQQNALQKKEDLRLIEVACLALQTSRFDLFGEKDPVHEQGQMNVLVQQSRERLQQVQQNLQHKQEQLKISVSRADQYGTEVKSIQQKLIQRREQLLSRLDKIGMQSIDELNSWLLDEETEQGLAVFKKDLDQELETLMKMLEETTADWQTEKDKQLTTDTEDVLTEKIEQLQQSISALHQTIGTIKTILNSDEQLKQKFKGLSAEIELQKTAYQKWLKLSDLIGSADGKKFRRFAQGLTLSRLADLANQHLSKLSDRYQILKSNDNTLELFIVDGYQADVVRPMATLSGGESFLVSLALALGLSDLASKKIQINSLFIDEGFGTLDADTLDLAISALENLQAKGKTIGIISHVESLKERIGTQIQLSKQSGGSSKIKIVSYLGAE